MNCLPDAITTESVVRSECYGEWHSPASVSGSQYPNVPADARLKATPCWIWLALLVPSEFGSAPSAEISRLWTTTPSFRLIEAEALVIKWFFGTRNFIVRLPEAAWLIAGTIKESRKAKLTKIRTDASTNKAAFFSSILQSDLDQSFFS